MKSNTKNFKDYLKDKYKGNALKKYYIDKQNLTGNIERGIIFIYEEQLPLPDWVEYLNILSEKKQIPIKQNHTTKAVLFLTIKGSIKSTFAIPFGHGISLLDKNQLAPDFGLKVSKSLLSMKEIISIDSTSIDRKIFNTKKQSVEFLMPEKLLEYGTQNIVKNIHGTYKEEFSLGGSNSINFKGNIDLLNDLISWLNQFAELYAQGQNNLGLYEELISVDASLQQVLDEKLGEKILNIIDTNPITRRQTSSIKILPNEVFEISNFNGFFINGLRYKKSQASSGFTIDELIFFEKFKRQVISKTSQDILNKLKTNLIYWKNADTGEFEEVCTIYKALNYETSYRSKKFILVSGKWYEIDKEFYSTLQKDIDNITEPDSIVNFIDFDSNIHFKTVKKKKQLSEGKYNEDLAKQNGILMLDREDYRPDKATMKKYGIKPQSSIELCDALYFDKYLIQFIHVKRHAGASGTSHLLTQALVSSYAFVNDNKSVTDHINKIIEDFNNVNTTSNLLNLNYTNQKKEVVLAIIDNHEKIKKAKKNSKLLSLLEMISLRENVKNLEHRGFKCYLKFIPGKE